VTVVNESDQAVTVNLYAADAFTTPDGGFGLQPDYKPKLHMGAWVHLPVSSLTIPPHSGDLVPFTFDPPGNTPPGDYAGGIVAEQQQGSLRQHGSVTVDEIHAVGARVYGRIMGPLHPRLRVTRTSLSHTSPFGSQFGGSVDVSVTYSVTNTGNQNLTPDATVSVSPLIGGSKSRKRHLPQVLPGSTVTFTEKFHDVTPFGELRAKVDVRAAGAAATGANDALVIPWGLVASVVLLLVLAWLLLRRWRGRRGPPPDDEARPPDDEPEPAAGETEPTGADASAEMTAASK
jgi:hypothetical protein